VNKYPKNAFNILADPMNRYVFEAMLKHVPETERKNMNPEISINRTNRLIQYLETAKEKSDEGYMKDLWTENPYSLKQILKCHLDFLMKEFKINPMEILTSVKTTDRPEHVVKFGMVFSAFLKSLVTNSENKSTKEFLSFFFEIFGNKTNSELKSGIRNFLKKCGVDIRKTEEKQKNKQDKKTSQLSEIEFSL